MNVIDLDKYIIARALETGQDLSAQHWARIDAAILIDPEWKAWVREHRIYRGLERARRRP